MEVPCPIVCHRGYHDVKDSLSRPIENTLESYLKAWKLGFVHAECDITLSTDGDIFLCHDSTFKRLGKENQPTTQLPAHEMSTSDFNSLSLLDGSKPPHLSEVLQCAATLSKGCAMNKQLVVEIKGCDDDARIGSKCAEALCAYLESHTNQLQYLSVLMSFDVEAMRLLARWRKRCVMEGFEVEQLSRIKFLLLRDKEDCLLSDPSTVRSAGALVSELQLDGLYCEFQPEMLDPSKSFDARACSIVGVWNYALKQPDGLEFFDRLLPRGVKFINSDLPGDLLTSFRSKNFGFWRRL